MKICWKCIQLQAIKDVEEFASSLEQIWSNLAWHHLLTNGSFEVNGCRQNNKKNNHNNTQVICF